MAKTKNTTVTNSSGGFANQEKLAWGISLLAAVSYYLYSFKSVGYYQHDEIAHLLNMYDFWNNPSSILGNWPKTGYKLVYAVPALLGSKFLIVLNCLIAGLTCYLAYRTAEIFDRSYALLAAVLLATQPMWIEISFRNYADSFSGFILIAAIYFHYRNKSIPAGLLLSFSTLVRQEFFLIAIPYGIFLLIQRRWLAAFLMGVFPVLYNIWGAVVSGDWLYLINSSKATSELYADQFVQYGFFHFWRMSFITWGAVPVMLSVLFFALCLDGILKKDLKKRFDQSPWFLLIPAAVYLLIHSLFNYEDLKLGASPNMRYMNGIAPVLAVMGTVALSAWNRSREHKIVPFVTLGVALLAYYAYASYEHNGVLLVEDKPDYKLFFFGLLTAAFLVIRLSANTSVLLYSGLALISGILPVQVKKLSPEELTIKNLATWIGKNNKQDALIFSNHNVVPYFYEKQTGIRPTNMKSLDSAGIASAPVGTLVIIESHYSLRKDFPAPAESIRNTFLETRDFNGALNAFVQLHQGNYVMAQEFISKDQRFGAFVFEKVK